MVKRRLDKNGLHLFDRSSGFNVLLDELNPPPGEWDRAPRYVSIALTNACELKCEFCYAPKSPARLEAEAVVRWVRELDESGCLGVGFGGGEPTAHPRFVEICQESSKTTSLAVTVTTHAHRFTDQLVRDLGDAVHFIRVSVDALESDYERIRGRSFEQLVKKLNTVSNAAPFGLNMVVGNSNLDQLGPMAKFADEVGADELLLIPQHEVSGVEGISVPNLERLAGWIKSYRGEVRLAVSRLGIPGGLPLAEPYGEDDPLSAHAHLDAFGQVRTDAFAGKGVRVGESVVEAIDQLKKEGVW